MIGSPITHSKSPLLHRAAYTELGLDWSYEAVEVGEGDFDSFVQALDSGWRGLSVTMPHKENAFNFADSTDSFAEYTGVVNTLAFSRANGYRTSHGYNTDVFGITSAISSAESRDFQHGCIIGGGATARSAIVALDLLGVDSITIAVRNQSKSQELLNLGHRLGRDLNVVPLNALDIVPVADVVVSTIPGSSDVSLKELNRSEHATLLDVAYDVWPSPRAMAWLHLDGHAISGLSMLAYQALMQVRIFVAGTPDGPLANEDSVKLAMFKSVGLDSSGLL